MSPVGSQPFPKNSVSLLQLHAAATAKTQTVNPPGPASQPSSYIASSSSSRRLQFLLALALASTPRLSVPSLRLGGSCETEEGLPLPGSREVARKEMAGKRRMAGEAHRYRYR